MDNLLPVDVQITCQITTGFGTDPRTKTEIKKFKIPMDNFHHLEKVVDEEVYSCHAYDILKSLFRRNFSQIGAAYCFVVKSVQVITKEGGDNE